MQLPDLVNGVFEGVIGVLAWWSVKALIRDKEVRGVNWFLQIWAMLWGWFNLYYYPHLGQWISFAGGLSIFGANTTWVALYGYYRLRRGAKDDSPRPLGPSTQVATG